MREITALLDKAKKTRSIASDNALAGFFAVHRQAVSKWRTGEAYPSEDHIARLAEMAGEDAGEWLVRIQVERSSGKAAAAWSSVYRRIATAATLALAAIPFCVVGQNLYIMSHRRRLKARSGAVSVALAGATFCS